MLFVPYSPKTLSLTLRIWARLKEFVPYPNILRLIVERIWTARDLLGSF